MTGVGTRARGVRRPPGPPSLPLYAGLLAGRSPASIIARVAASHPRLAYLRLGREHLYLLTEPELVHDVFVRHGREVRKGRALNTIKVLLGDGLLTSEGELHHRQRRLIQPAFHARRIRGYAEWMVQAARDTDARWRQAPHQDTDPDHRAGPRRDVFRDMSELTLGAVGGALFGSDLTAARAEVAACMETLLGGFSRNVLPGADLLLRLPTPGNARLFRAVERLDRVVHQVIRDRRNAPAGPDLLSALVHAEDTEAAMDDRQVRDEVMTLLLAGHETTATALTWAWWLLDTHRDVAAWLHEELDAAPDPPSYDDLPALPRTHAVLAETMRLFPPSWLLGRRACAKLAVDGWTVPEGALCVASQWVLHRDPRFWSWPRAFVPARWLDADGRFDESAPGQPRDTYLPFGLGSRVCVGASFAWTEGVLVLATLARRWTPRTVDGHQVRPHASVTLRPKGGLPMHLDRRNTRTL